MEHIVLSFNQVMFFAVCLGVLLILSVTSVITLFMCIDLKVRLDSSDKSTHTIEYRDPHNLYPDELKLERNDSGVVEQVIAKEEPQDMDAFNKHIEEKGLII